MSTMFMNVLRQTFKTFDRSNQAGFNNNFALLKHLTEQLTIRDLNLSRELLSDEMFNRLGHAPCTYIHIYENCEVSLSVFIMRAGYTMPLHDHPMMHGLLRGIFGQLRVQSYTQKLQPYEKIADNLNRQLIEVIKEEPRSISENTECAVLTPYECNFHEITAVNGVAAFFDILSPPYQTHIPGYGVCHCTFYRVVEPVSDAGEEQTTNSPAPTVANSTTTRKCVDLERIPTPTSYFCDTAQASDDIKRSTYLAISECLRAA